jgi:two-component system, OmpR family, response regulator MprA
MEDNKKVLLVDDDPEILSLLKKGLTLEGYAVETASDGPDALSRVPQFEPDVVVLDVTMPGMDGLEVSRKLRAISQIPILMLTARGTVRDRVAGLDSGADDYLVKPFALDELSARLRALLRRGPRLDSEVLSFGDVSMNTSTREVKRGESLLELTAQEYSLLEFLLRHPRQVLKRDQIYEQVWGYDFGGESNVIEVYILYLRNKLEAGGQPRVIHTVRGVGYVLKE